MRHERIKVADFGLSKMFVAEDLTSQCGSPTYVAPEVLMSKKPYDKAVDMWAVGVVTFVILTGCFPFYEEGKNYGALYQRIMNVDYFFPDEPRLSPEGKLVETVTRLCIDWSNVSKCLEEIQQCSVTSDRIFL